MAEAFGEDHKIMKPLNTCVKPRDGEKFKHPPVLKIEVELDIAHCPESNSSYATFCFQDTTSDVEEDGKDIGTVSAGLGAVVFLRDHRPDKEGYSYYLDPRKLWAAFQKAFAEQKV